MAALGDAAHASATANSMQAAASSGGAITAPFDALSLLCPQGQLCTGGSLRELVSKYQGVEGLVALNPGLPPDDCFPIKGMQLDVQGVDAPVHLTPEALVTAQQLGLSCAGHPPLVRWVAAHVEALHAPPGPHDVLITTGSSNGLDLVASLFLGEGDAVVVEEFTYPQMLECQLVPRRCRMLPVAMDYLGIIPAALEQVLQEAEARGEPKPKMLYTVPTGQNPTSASVPLERKREVYDICCRHGLLLLEDDAYQYLQFPLGPTQPPGLSGLPHRSSYLSLDTDGRVIRLDTCTKFLAPGLRLGWAVAAPAVIQKMTDLLQGQTLGPSGLSQVIACEMLTAWGEEGLERHLCRLQATYAEKAGALHMAALSQLAGMAEWREPEAGMFMWVRLLGVDDATDLLEAMLEAKVVVVPGRVCHPRGTDPTFKCPYIRVSFANPSAAECTEGILRLGTVLRNLRMQHKAQRDLDRTD
ncbi:hypothetical protein D9Q98_007030 [Chlorella vulgaris]|uniref:Aminotransferase class I/classII large domain-containing protein n=1 Tax=Chlorella vulgaris TaxID=3077 RepID=A0A9D4TJC8_CHLVU|nr:hypothetical protein D9Q98_007030 [Chlorella vulgaris]